MATLCKTTDDYNLYRLKMIDLPHGYKKIDSKRPKELDHIDNDKYIEIVKIINKGISKFYKTQWDIYYNAIIYITLQVIISIYLLYLYLTNQEQNVIYLIIVIVIAMSNFLLNDVCEMKLSMAVDLIIYRINRNIRKYSEKNNVQWKFEIVVINDIKQIYLKYYIHRKDYDPPDPLE